MPKRDKLINPGNVTKVACWKLEKFAQLEFVFFLLSTPLAASPLNAEERCFHAHHPLTDGTCKISCAALQKHVLGASKSIVFLHRLELLVISHRHHQVWFHMLYIRVIRFFCLFFRRNMQTTSGSAWAYLGKSYTACWISNENSQISGERTFAHNYFKHPRKKYTLNTECCSATQRRGSNECIKFSHKSS